MEECRSSSFRRTSTWRGEGERDQKKELDGGPERSSEGNRHLSEGWGPRPLLKGGPWPDKLLHLKETEELQGEGCWKGFRLSEGVTLVDDQENGGERVTRKKQSA